MLLEFKLLDINILNILSKGMQKNLKANWVNYIRKEQALRRMNFVLLKHILGSTHLFQERVVTFFKEANLI